MKPQVSNVLRDNHNVDCYATENPQKITVLCGNAKLYIELFKGANRGVRCTLTLIRNTGIISNNVISRSQPKTYQFVASTIQDVADMVVSHWVDPVLKHQQPL